MKGCIGMHCLWPAGEPVSNCRLSPSPVFVNGSRIVMAPSGGARSRGGGGAGRGRKGEPRGPGPPRCPGDGDGWTEVSEGQGAEGMGGGGQVLEPGWPWWPRHTPGKPPEPRSHCAGRGFELAALGSRTVASLCLAGSLGPAYQSPNQAQATASQIPQQSKGGRREKRRLTRRGARGDASVCGGGSSLWLRGARGDPASVRSPTQILPRQ